MLEHVSDLWWALVLLGFGAGVLGGALGVGGGIILVPALVFVFLVPQKSAQGTALAVMVPMALLGAIRYWRNPDAHIDLWVVALLAGGALVGVLIGTGLAARLPGPILRKAFAVFMVIMAAYMFFSPVRGKASPPQTAPDPQTNVTEVEGQHDE